MQDDNTIHQLQCAQGNNSTDWMSDIKSSSVYNINEARHEMSCSCQSVIAPGFVTNTKNGGVLTCDKELWLCGYLQAAAVPACPCITCKNNGKCISGQQNCSNTHVQAAEGEDVSDI